MGGFSTPFMVLGGILFLTALITRLALPVHEKYQANTKTTGRALDIIIYYFISFYFVMGSAALAVINQRTGGVKTKKYLRHL